MTFPDPKFLPLAGASGLNHARQSAQTDSPLFDTTNQPGRPAEVNSTVSRRKFMTTASVAAASTVVASPSIAATGNDYTWPDLAARFERYHARWRRRRELDEIMTEDDHEESENRWDEIITEQNALARLILDRRPETIADIVLQARTTAAINNELWIEACSIEDADSGRLAFRRLIDRLCEFAGVQVFPDTPRRSPASTTAILNLGAATSPDAELMRLGTQFDAIRIELDASNDKTGDLQRLCLQEITARYGQSAVHGDNFLPFFRTAESHAAVIAAEQHNSKLADKIESIVALIMATPATGCAGLAVKMRVLRWMLRVSDEGDRRDQDLNDQWFNEIDDEVNRIAQADVISTAMDSKPAVASVDDPIFTAIRSEKCAWNEFYSYLGKDDRDRERDREIELSDLHDAAADELYRTVPKTRAGHEALILHVIKMINLECGTRVDEDPFHITGAQLIALLKNLRLNRRTRAIVASQ